MRSTQTFFASFSLKSMQNYLSDNGSVDFGGNRAVKGGDDVHGAAASYCPHIKSFSWLFHLFLPIQYESVYYVIETVILFAVLLKVIIRMFTHVIHSLCQLFLLG